MKRAPHGVAARIVALALVALAGACATSPRTTDPAPGGEPAAKAAATPSGEPIYPPCTQPPPCGDDCSNYPFEPTQCWTTEYGPARANVIVGAALSSTNMLYCREGSYALCFFSGPPWPGGTSDDNRELPCIREGKFANCTCQVYTSGPYFVDINSILNLGAFYETVQKCGTLGEDCANIVNCGRDGSLAGCDQQQPAPVCGYVRNQDPDDPTVSLMPEADLISAFSFAMDGDYNLGSTPCHGLYAGCMTAPCFFEKGARQPPQDGDPIQCQCPTYVGDYQVGQNQQQCSLRSESPVSYVWSAANSVATSDSP